MNALTPPATARDLIDKQIDGELAKARKSHVGYFRGGASVPPVPAREKLPPRVLILRRQGTSLDYPLVGNVRPYAGTIGDRLAFRDVDAAAEHARANRWHLRVELDLPVGYPLPTMDSTEVSAEQVAEWEREQAAKAAPAAA